MMSMNILLLQRRDIATTYSFLRTSEIRWEHLTLEAQDKYLQHNIVILYEKTPHQLRVVHHAIKTGGAPRSFIEGLITTINEFSNDKDYEKEY